MNPTWELDTFHKKVVHDLKCKISRHQLYRAKKRALRIIHGKHEAQYTKHWDYAAEVRRVMPENTIRLLTEDPLPGGQSGRFMRFYVCLQPLKEGYKEGHRPLFGLDGCHLKSPLGGQL